MEREYRYFKRDTSWLSFNYRVLMEAMDESVPIYDRIRFLSIYSSNLEEFYEIRVAEHRGKIMRKNFVDESVEEAEAVLNEITGEVNRQQREFYRTLRDGILPSLKREHVYLYQDCNILPFHREFVRNFFEEEVFPFLSPMLILAGEIRTFLRDRRLYLVVRLKKVESGFHYALIKIPFSKVPRFIELPEHEGMHYLMFIDDIIRVNLDSVFPGYEIDGCYSIKISRDADIYLDDDKSTAKELVETIRKKVKRRKIGNLSRFMYDQDMPDDFLDFICNAFDITRDELVVGGRYMNLQDMAALPNPTGRTLTEPIPEPLHVPYMDEAKSIFTLVKEQDALLFFPYQSFDYLLRFLREAAEDKKVEEIKITQYRVAENSAVINALVHAANLGKAVTVFVELKARFDEEHNLETAERMKQAGIRILYSLPGLKVHAKVAVVNRCVGTTKRKSFAYLSTGNFNEKTARVYSDMALLTSKEEIVNEVNQVFSVLEGTLTQPTFDHLLVAQFEMVPQLIGMIRREVEHQQAGRKGRIILKMNGLHDKTMITELYKASEAGVEIDLIVRGICCLVPDQPYSKNIRITRIVDVFLEHARIWYFYNDGAEDLYLTSADWMQRNLYRRIESACPIYDPAIKQEIMKVLDIQLHDNVKAVRLNDHLHNIYKRDDNPVKIRAQEAIYEYIKRLTNADQS